MRSGSNPGPFLWDLKMSDEQTLRFYAEHARTYAARGAGATEPRLQDFIAALPPGAHVLELGTGGGHHAAHTLAQGLVVDATDASPDLASEAEKRIGRPVAIMRFDQLTASGIYDGVWASAALLHAPAGELTDDLARIHNALRPGGPVRFQLQGGVGRGARRLWPLLQLSRCHHAGAAFSGGR